MNDESRQPRLDQPEPTAHGPGPGMPGRAPDHQRTRPLVRWVLGFGVLVLMAGALTIGIMQHYAQYRAVSEAAERRRVDAPSVRTGVVRESGKTMTVSLPATTLAFNSANIYGRASGYIARRYVDIGSRVTAGQPLADVVALELDHQIAQAQANLTQAEATLRQAQANLELAKVTRTRSSTLAPAGYATQQQADNDRLSYRAQEQAVAAADASLAAQRAYIRVLEQQKAYQRVVAPFDGVVTQRNVDVGSLVQADNGTGTALFTMVHSDVIRVQVYVPQDAAVGVKPDIDTTVRVPELPGRTFRGTVTRIADSLQLGTRTLLTEIDVANPDGALTPGIYCTVALEIPRRVPSLIVPGAAVIFNHDGLQVAVVENGIIHMRKISAIRDFGTEVEATDGVNAGDRVVLNPWIDLADGNPVEDRRDAASATP
jgi:RND family efflux transporter MFP subunit